MELARKVTINRANKTVLINDVEFPYFLAEQGPDVDNPLSNNDIPVIHLPVIAEEVEIIPAPMMD